MIVSIGIDHRGLTIGEKSGHECPPYSWRWALRLELAEAKLLRADLDVAIAALETMEKHSTAAPGYPPREFGFR
jgi:hypothetical protein